MRQFNSECDPAHECLTAVHAFLICIAPEFSLHLCFLPLSAFFYLSSDFRNFPPRRFSNTNAKPSLFSSVFPQKSLFFPHQKCTQNWKYSSLVHWSTLNQLADFFFFLAMMWGTHDLACTWRWTFWPLPFPIMTFELSADHKTCSSHESSPPGVAGNRLLWPSGLGSHGETHYCSHMAGYMQSWNHVSSIFWQISASLRPMSVSQDTSESSWTTGQV